jgi:hypothetical protein
MKLLTYTLLLFYCNYSLAQNNLKVKLYAGLNTRVTPIYLEQVPSHIFTPRVSDLEQPDKHVSGPGLKISSNFYHSLGIVISVHQVIRYDFLYQTMPLEEPTPSNFDYKIKKKFIYDSYIDIGRIFTSRTHAYIVSGGFALCGINTGYVQITAVGNNPVTYMKRNKNFTFPALTTTLTYEKSRISAALKIGYCWNDPRLYNTPFLFPELSLQYRFH